MKNKVPLMKDSCQKVESEFRKVFTADSIYRRNNNKLNNTIGSKQINPECEILYNCFISSVSYSLIKQAKREKEEKKGEVNNRSLKEIYGTTAKCNICRS